MVAKRCLAVKTISTINTDAMKRLLYLFFLLLLFACSPHNGQDTLTATDSLLTIRPDSALMLLEKMQNIGQMNETGVMHYVWNRAMAHQAMGMSLEEDSLTPNAVAYYRQHNDMTRLLDGYLLKASYLRWTGHNKDALSELEEGIMEAKRRGNEVKLLALVKLKIDLLTLSNNHADAAQTAYTILNGHYNLDNDARGNLLFFLGLNLSLLNDKQADRYYNESIQLALASHKKEVAAERIRTYAESLAEKGEYARSNQYISRFQKLMPQYAGYSAIQLSLANNYANLHQLDSARYCLERAKASESELEKAGQGSLSRKASIEQLQNVLNYTDGKTISSLAFSRYCDSVTTVMLDKENTSLRRLEARNKLQAENYELHRSRLRMLLGIVLLFVLLLGGGSLAYRLYRRKYQRLAEAEDCIETLTEMLNRMHVEPVEEALPATDDANFFRKVLLQQLGIIRLVASTPTNQNQALLKRISAISCGEIPTHDLLNWDDLYPIIDRLYNQFHTRLTQHYGNLLTEKETQICCLLCAGFSTKEIGVVTQQTSATIYVRKTSVRRKIGVPEGEDIVAYVNAI